MIVILALVILSLLVQRDTLAGELSGELCSECLSKGTISYYFSPSVPLSLEPTPFPETEGWIPGETSVSKLSREEQDRLLGIPLEVFEKLPQSAELHSTLVSKDEEYPEEIDWRNYQGRDWTTPIRDQMGCASCSAFGSIAAIESRLEIAIGNPDFNPDLSEAHPFFCGCGSCCGSGWFIESVLDFARDIGITYEECYPYQGYYEPCSPCEGWQNQVAKISSYGWTWDVEAMKWELANHGPIITSIHIHDDFYNYTGGIYRYTWGESRGGHAVALVGYNEEEQYWIGKNSWGTGWGEEGWFRIAYGDSMVDHYIQAPRIDSNHIFLPFKSTINNFRICLIRSLSAQ